MKAEADRSAQAGEGRSVKPYSAALVGDLLRAFDVAVVLLLGLAIYLVYVYPGEPHTSDRYFVTLVLMTATVGLMFQWLGVYSDDFVFRKGLRTSRMLSAWAVTFALFLAVAFALKISSFYSRVWAVSWFFSSAAVLMLARAFLSHHIGRLARRGRFANRTVIVGTGAQADRLAIHLAERDAVRTQVIGFIDDRATTSDRTTPEHGVLGGMDELIRLIRSDQVDQVFMALPWNQADHLRDI
ncbi:MAG: hypothetical protein GWN84_04470, partial [Gammaproteobacteria bacterium]|nr:hypothetical protein [Gammaproteobacteria bacterium]NIR82792.1 hypothetical protein [Gammaproteobacteria bacterium]NIR89901.1 hypothetical protein [Gammaproteobacteria bacterium]NIX05878.1 hypothetical protein [Gammaproteobacteria bacterium]